MEIIARFGKATILKKQAEWLMEYAARAGKLGYPGVEIGSYVGTSAIFLGTGLGAHNQVVFAIDPHTGSDEHTEEEGMFEDSEIRDKNGSTFTCFQESVITSGASEHIIPIVARSEMVGPHWTTPLSIVFLDGAHDVDSVIRDFYQWECHIVTGGYLIFHDCVLDEELRKQRGDYEGPPAAYKLAIDSGHYKKEIAIGSMVICKKVQK